MSSENLSNSQESVAYSNKLKRSRAEAGLESPDLITLQNHNAHQDVIDTDDDIDSCDGSSGRPGTPGPKPGKKTRGRVKINMEFIDNKLRRYTTFSKRKSGIMKKAHELATLTGTQVMLLVASETGHVYTFATRKLQPILSSEAGKQLIQTCLNSPDPPDANQNQNFDKERMSEQRMSAQGFEEPDLTYAPPDETKEGVMPPYSSGASEMEHSTHSPHNRAPEPPHSHAQTTEHSNNVILAPQVPVNLIAMGNPVNHGALHLPASYTFVTDSTQVQHRSIDLSNNHHQSTSIRQTQSPSVMTSFAQPTIMQYSSNIGVQPILWSPALQVPPPVIPVISEQGSGNGNEKQK